MLTQSIVAAHIPVGWDLSRAVIRYSVAAWPSDFVAVQSLKFFQSSLPSHAIDPKMTYQILASQSTAINDDCFANLWQRSLLSCVFGYHSNAADAQQEQDQRRIMSIQQDVTCWTFLFKESLLMWYTLWATQVWLRSKVSWGGFETCQP